jgi:phosphomannomutase
MHCGIPAIMMTGSHIPHDRNGFKFYCPHGEITKIEERQILETDVAFSRTIARPELLASKEAVERYASRYQHFLNASPLADKRISIYDAQQCRERYLPCDFPGIGGRGGAIGAHDDFVPVDTEVLSKNDEQRALSWIRQYDLDALFSTDGDGNKPMLADEQGDWLKGDWLGLLCCQYLGIQSLTMPLNCNSAVEQSSIVTQVVRIRIGSPYVLEAMEHLAGKVAGFEANRGFMLGNAIDDENRHLAARPTRDALLPALATLSLTREKGLSAALIKLPSRFTHSNRIKANSAAFMQKAISEPLWLLEVLGLAADMRVDIDLTDGIRIQLADHNIIHLPASANAPELRCYAEAGSQQEAKKLVGNILCLAKDIMNSWNSQ